MLTITLKLEGDNQEVINTMKNFLITLEQESVIDTDVQVPVIEKEEVVLPLLTLETSLVPRRVLSYKKRFKEGQQMLTMRDKGKSILEISNKFGVSKKQATNIIHYERNVRPKNQKAVLPEVETFSHPTERDLRNLQIVELHKTGMMPVALGNKFNLRPNTVSSLCWRAKKEGWY